MDFSIIKKHPYVFGGGLAALFLIIYLKRHHSAAGSSADLSGGANQVQALSAAASLQNAQANAGVEVAQLQAGAAAQVALAQTAAQLEATKTTVAAQEAVALSGQQAGITSQQIAAEAEIAKTQIEAATAANISANTNATAVKIAQQANVVPLAQINEQEKFYSILASKNKLGGDSTGVTQILSGVYGRGPQAIAANQPTMVSNSAPNIISAVSSGASKLLSGLFA